MEFNKIEINKPNVAQEAAPIILKELPSIEYQIKDDNNKSYILKIIQDENTINFVVNIVGDISKILYKKIFSLKDFYNSNRIFRQYISIEELYSLLFKSLKQSEIIIKQINKKVILTFIVEFREKKDEIPFILEPEEPKKVDIVLNLCEKIKEIEFLKKENISTNNKIKELELKLNDKDKIISKLISK